MDANRRAFLLAAALAGTAMGRPTLAGQAPDDWAEAFAASRRLRPWTAAFRSAPRGGFDCASLAVDGNLPQGLEGVFYRLGPARHDIFGLRYHHWFDGDGMLQAFRFQDGAVSHRGRYVETDKFRSENQAKRRLWPAFGTAWPGAAAVANPDEINPANINVVEHGGQLLALWEGGSPWRVEPQSLATLGRHHWSPETAGLPFTAHPRREPDGTLWAFGNAPWADTLLLYRIAADGQLVKAASLAMTDLGMVHDFVVTERHLVIPVTSLVLDRVLMEAGNSYLDSHRWRPELGLRVLVIDKNELTIARRFTLPPGLVLHYGNGWEEADGTIHVDGCRFADASVLFETLRYAMRGEWRPGASPHAARFRLSGRNERAELEISEHIVEFPRIDPRLVGRRHRQVWSVAWPKGPLAAGPEQSAIMRRDLETGAVDSYDYGAGIIAEEPVFVPRPGGDQEGDGWVIGTSFDTRSATTTLAVFAALALAAGPLAVAHLPYGLPLGFHGSFVSA